MWSGKERDSKNSCGTEIVSFENKLQWADGTSLSEYCKSNYSWIWKRI